MDGYLELALSEYDFHKGYDSDEITRCLDLLREHLEILWGVSDSDNDSEDDNVCGNIPLDLFAEEGLDEEDITLILEECRAMMEVMLEGMSPIAAVPVQHLTISNPDPNPDTSASIIHSNPEPIDIDESLRQLECYRGTDQQRTPDWYAKRRQMITASASHKILKVDISSGKGIGVLREKILPPPADNGYMNLSVSLLGDTDVEAGEDDKIIGIVSNAIPSNPDAPNVRGQRYEPIIRQMYEKKYNVVVEEYDCVTHPMYPFIGASPDGIITKGANRGRMTEIKCPNEASAIKDGLQVRDEYWSQMQLQMEVCNLPECDYVRAVVRDTDTISGIQKIIQDQVSRIRTSHGFDESAPLIAASGTIWMGTNGKYIEEADGKFVHENSIHLRYKHRVVFIRHYVIFWRDVFIKTVYRDRSWFQQRFLPKAIECWAEIQRGLRDPEAWNLKYPLKRRGKRGGLGGSGDGSIWGVGGNGGNGCGDVCLLMDD